MRRECVWCGKFMEEVCPECGASGSPLKERWLAWLVGKLLRAPSSLLFVCTNFDYCSTLLFGRGAGKQLTTHGICAACAAKERERESKLHPPSSVQ